MTAARRVCLILAVLAGMGTGVTPSASPARAQPRIIPGITVMTIVKWSGADCIPARTADGNRDLCNTVAQPRSDAIVKHGHSVGDLVGADPAMGRADWVSCELFLNGSPTMHDVALAGDGSDVTCLTVLQ